MNKIKNKVVQIGVLGSGFGAMHTALALKKQRSKLPSNINLEVELISRDDYFWLVTMAHEIATGNLLPDDVMQPLRSMPTDVYDNFIQANVTGIDASEMKVGFDLVDTVEVDKKKQARSYDYIVSSLGSKAHFFGVEGAAEYSLPLKTLDDVRRIKNRVMQSFEDAEILTDTDQIKALLSFVVVGGGASGVEIAGEMADLINDPLTKRFPKVARFASITIVHGGKSVGIPGVEWMSKELENILTKKHCVKVMCDSMVSRVSDSGVNVGEKFLPSKTVIWSGGVMASEVRFSGGVTNKTKQGRVVVNSDLSLPNFKNIFVIGDQASVNDQSGKEYPMRAQFAVRQGRLVAENIIRDILCQPRSDFVYQDKGVIVSLGNGSALADVFGQRIKGRAAYWMYKVAYLPQLIGWRPRIKTALSWFMNLFLPRDLSKL